MYEIGIEFWLLELSHGTEWLDMMICCGMVSWMLISGVIIYRKRVLVLFWCKMEIESENGRSCIFILCTKPIRTIQLVWELYFLVQKCHTNFHFVLTECTSYFMHGIRKSFFLTTCSYGGMDCLVVWESKESHLLRFSARVKLFLVEGKLFITIIIPTKDNFSRRSKIFSWNWTKIVRHICQKIIHKRDIHWSLYFWLKPRIFFY